MSGAHCQMANGIIIPGCLQSGTAGDGGWVCNAINSVKCEDGECGLPHKWGQKS